MGCSEEGSSLSSHSVKVLRACKSSSSWVLSSPNCQDMLPINNLIGCSLIPLLFLLCQGDTEEKIIPFLCAASLHMFDACDHAPSVFFTLNNPNMFSLSSKARVGKPPSSLLAPSATSPTGVRSSSHTQKRAHHPSHRLTTTSQRRWITPFIISIRTTASLPSLRLFFPL